MEYLGATYRTLLNTSELRDTLVGYPARAGFRAGDSPAKRLRRFHLSYFAAAVARPAAEHCRYRTCTNPC
jgi:hypothetical protein